MNVSMIDKLSRFQLGRLVATPGVLLGVSPDDIRAGLARHARCDWGELSDEDKQENDYSLARRLRLLSAYRSRSGTKFWIITEADRSSTTILLPEEY
jgi:hypothetical protein